MGGPEVIFRRARVIFRRAGGHFRGRGHDVQRCHFWEGRRRPEEVLFGCPPGHHGVETNVIIGVPQLELRRRRFRGPKPGRLRNEVL